MMNNKMEEIRNQLNEMIISENINRQMLLEKSQELDIVIVQSMRTQKTVYMGRKIMGDDIMKKLESLLHKLEIFEKMYQSMRIVDPTTKKVLELKNNYIEEHNSPCFGFWGKSQICDNCISIRALNQDDTIFKIEYKEDSIYMITAVPITINNKKLVVEFLKNTTDNLIFGDEKHSENIKIITMIEYMNQIAVRDALTEQFNRRFINERLPIEIINSSISQEPLSVIFTDLDNFKKVNDTYGHAAGDMVLKEFSKELQMQIRNESDWVARYGGEEFLVCLSNTDYEQAKIIAERMRSKVEKRTFNFEGQAIKVTSSFGVVTVCDNGECLTIDSILELADKKLYQAKNEGRNRVV